MTFKELSQTKISWRRIKFLILNTALAVLLPFTAAQADIAGEMNKFLDDMGFKTNSTSAQRYKGQSAGYYTGGSVYARSKVINTPVANFQVPRIEVGCGGIDIFGGSFSFINEDQFVAIAKAVASNALGYGFNMGLKAICPTCQQSLHELQEKMDKINQFNINSCEIASSLNDSLSAKLSAHQSDTCEKIGSKKGAFADFNRARLGCKTSNKAKGQVAGADAEDKAAGMGNRNITWDVLSSQSIGDDEYKQLVMSLIGTIIINGENIQHYIGLVTDDEQLGKFLAEKPSEIKIYECVDTNCLTINETTKTLKTTFLKEVKDLIKNIMTKVTQEKMGNRPVLTEQEKAFIQNSPLPIYKIINVNLAYQKASGIFSLEEIEDYLAVGLLFDFMDRAITAAESAAKGNSGLSAEMKKQFDDNIAKTRAIVNQKAQKINRQFAYYNQVVERIDIIEAKLKKDLSKGVHLLKKSGS